MAVPKGFQFVLREDVDPKTLGAALRRLRESNNLSAGQLAERMGWISQNVLRLERGGGTDKRRREPTLSTINLYVRMLGFELVLVGRPMTPRTGKRREEDADAGDTESEGEASEAAE